MIESVLTSISILLGAYAGELIATKAFGQYRKRWLYLVESIIFVALIAAILANIGIKKGMWAESTIIFFSISLMLINFIKGSISAIGILAERSKEIIIKEKSEKDYIIGLKVALKRRGFKISEIKRIAKEVGFNEKKIDEALKDRSLEREIKSL